MIVAVFTVIAAVMIVAIVDMVASYHAKLRVIDRVTGEYGTTYRDKEPLA